MPTYPTNIRLAPRSINIVAKTQATAFTSPFGGQTQVMRYGGQWFELDLTLPPLFQTDAEEMTGFLLGLNGMDGTFTYKLPSKFIATSVPTPLTITGNGNTFTGGTGTVGKFAYAAGRLVQFTGTGSLFPRLPTGSTTFSTTAGATFRLASNDVQYSVDEMMLHGITFGIREVVL